MTMNPLCELNCKPCEGGVQPLSLEKANELLENAPGWKVINEGKALYREFSFKGFLGAMNFVNAVAYIANREGHHPDFQVGYNYCNLKFTTHAIDGLSENDFICAAKINALLK